MKKISTPNAPAPGGHYSQGVVHNGFVFVSGQLPIDAKSGEKVLDSIEAQTECALKNMAAVLEAAGSRLDLVIKTTVYVSDIQLWDRVNQIYASFFGEHKPARAVVPTRALHHGFLIEIEAIAEVDEKEKSSG
jgi:2-iminobutanoate/2-iminopropanoate deaminase